MTYLFAIYSLKRYAKLNELKLSCLTFPSRFRKIIILVIEDNHFVINLSSKSSYLAFLSVSIHIKLIHKKQIYFLPLSLSLSMSLFIYIIFLLFAFTFYCCNSFSGFYPSALPGSGYIPIFFVYRLCPFVSSFGFPAFAFLSIWVPSFFCILLFRGTIENNNNRLAFPFAASPSATTADAGATTQQIDPDWLEPSGRISTGILTHLVLPRLR